MSLICGVTTFLSRLLSAQRWLAGATAFAVVLLSVAPRAVSQAETADSRSSFLKIGNASELPTARTMTLGLGKALIVDLPVDAKDTIISDPKTIDVAVLTARRLLIVTKEIGVSNVFVMGREGNRLLTLDINVRKDISELGKMLSGVLPGSKIRVSHSGTGIVLSGTVAAPADSARAAEVAAQYLGAAAKVVNLITTGNKEQILLKVTIAELQRDAIRRIGINVPEAVLKAGSLTFTKVMANSFPVSAGAAGVAAFAGAGQTPTIGSGTALQTTANFSGNSVSTMLEALERVGLSRTLAEPTLVAISGEAAKFHAGGELPVPVAQEKNVLSIAWKPFGVSVAFTPFVLSEGRISLKVAAEVSELSTQGAVVTQGISIPSVQVRKAETVVEMPSGSSLAMAGLLSDQTRQNTDGIPELKNLPILGALFRSKDFKNSQSELVILVTPYIVRPTDGTQLSRPDEGMVSPSPLRGLLNGHLHKVYSQLPADALKGEHGFVLEHPHHGVKD